MDMTFDGITVFFAKEDVITLDELAEELARAYDWKTWRMSGDGRYIIFKAKDSSDAKVKEGYAGPSGFAYHLEKDKHCQFDEQDSWDEYNIDWNNDVGAWNNYVWGEDSNGNTVMVHD